MTEEDDWRGKEIVIRCDKFSEEKCDGAQPCNTVKKLHDTGAPTIICKDSAATVLEWNKGDFE